MKIEIEQKILKAALAKLKICADFNNAYLPILTHIKIEALEDRAVLSSTNLDQQLSITLKVNVSEVGTVLLDGKKLIKAVGAMKGRVGMESTGMMGIEDEVQTVVFDNPKRRITFTSSPAVDDWPAVPSGFQKMHGLDALDVAGMIRRVGYGQGVAEIRSFLHGVLFERKEGNLRAVATDGHVLALENVASPGNDFKTMVAIDSTQVLSKLLDCDCLLRMTLNERNADMERGEHYFVRFVGETVLTKRTKKSDGIQALFTFYGKERFDDFPPYEQVIPSESEYNAILKLDRAELRKGVDWICKLTEQVNNATELKFGHDVMTLVSGDVEHEVAYETIEERDTLESAGLNALFLQEALKYQFSEDSVEMSVGEDRTPVMLRHDGGLALLMTMEGS